MSFRNQERPIYILAVGDSITQGGKRDRPEYTYRLPLQMLLHQNNIDYDFIGSRQKGLHDDASWPDVAQNVPFDPDHEGYYGNKTQVACQKVKTAFSGYQSMPDMVLIHLGTNDQKHGDFERNVGEPLRDFINFLRVKNPEVVVLLGHLNFQQSDPVLKIRSIVEEIAKDMNSEKSPIRTVHHYKNWTAEPDKVYTDTFDWAHPNLKGQEKMALNWYAAMKEFFH